MALLGPSPKESLKTSFLLLRQRMPSLQVGGCSVTVNRNVKAIVNHCAVAACCNEAFKIATSSAAYLNNYFMYMGNDSIYSLTFQPERRPDCPVCGDNSLAIDIGHDWTVERLIETLTERQDM